MFNPFAPMPRYAKSHLHWSCCEAFPSPRARLQVTEFVQWHRDLASCDMLRWALVVICANCLYLGSDIAYILLLSLEIFGDMFELILYHQVQAEHGNVFNALEHMGAGAPAQRKPKPGAPSCFSSMPKSRRLISWSHQRHMDRDGPAVTRSEVPGGSPKDRINPRDLHILYLNTAKHS